MRKILLLLVVSFFVGKNCEAQNLVPNPSFEDTVACPNSADQTFNATGWSQFSASPDYFNSCSLDTFVGSIYVGVPINFCGYQYASSGSAYCGLATYFTAGLNYREIVGRTLSVILTPGTKYYASIKVCLAEVSTFASNNIGISFSTIQYNEWPNLAPVNNQAMVYSTSVITDSSNWTTVSGSFVADSAYKYIMIGNFFTDENTDTLPSNTSSNFNTTYYYIDDVCVSPDSLACDLTPEGIYNLKEAKASINLYPNPATQQLIIDNGQLIIKEIEISDALGRVQSCEFKVQRPVTKIDIHSLPSGIYFIKVYFADGSMEVRRFVKE